MNSGNKWLCSEIVDFLLPSVPGSIYHCQESHLRYFHFFNFSPMTTSTFCKNATNVEPWLHVTYFIVGCIIGDYYPKAERRLVDDINATRAEKGLMPLVGTAQWIRYAAPEDAGEIGTKTK